MALNPKHRIFVREYLKDKNASRAYRAAGYTGKGAAQSASALLRDPNVKAAIDKGLAQQEAQLDLNPQRVLARLAEFAFQPLNKKELKNSASNNALRANELLAKHFKLLTDVQEHSGKGGAPIAFIALPANGSEAPNLDSPANPTAAPHDNDGDASN